MTCDLVTIEGIRMSRAAAQCVEYAGISPAVDLSEVRHGRVSEAELLQACLEGADPELEADWREYVEAIMEATAWDPA
jgi:hypothetical protein